MTFDNSVSFLATLLSLTSAYLISSKHYRAGFMVSLVSQLPWAYLGIKSSLYGLLVWSVAATLINIRGLLKLRTP
jgi:hydrogenase-4 membrane subunit HyfE